MSQSVLDPCLFFKQHEAELQALVGTLVDDTLATGTKIFAKVEQDKSRKFDVKPRDETLPFKFSGCV